MSFNTKGFYNSNGYHAPCTYLSDYIIHEGKWLRLSEIKYLDPHGRERCWETVTKLTKPKENDTDSVAAIAIYRRLLHYDVIVMVRQFRPPLNAYTIEFPAGLLDSGESCEQAAIRKLREETGWHGEVTHASDLLAVDAGCSSAVMRYATVKINGDSNENLMCKPTCMDNEFVDMLMIPVTELHERLSALSREGNIVDSRVEAFAIGLQMGLKFTQDARKDAASSQQASLPLDGSCVRTGLGSKQTT